MKILLIDTATSVCSVALASDGAVVAEALVNAASPSSARLTEAIGQVMSWAGCRFSDLHGFGVSVGPGAFTSIRVGLATVKGLAMSTEKPVAAYSSLSLLAASLPMEGIQVSPLFDARRGEVYGGLYRSGPIPVPLRPDCAAPPAEFLATLAEATAGATLFVGDGALRYRALIESVLGDRAAMAPAWAHLPRASTASAMATAMLQRGEGCTAAALSPVYLRQSQAELCRQGV